MILMRVLGLLLFENPCSRHSQHVNWLIDFNQLLVEISH